MKMDKRKLLRFIVFAITIYACGILIMGMIFLIDWIKTLL